MAMTDKDRILAYLRSLSPKAATNSEILEGTGIERPSMRRTSAVRRERALADTKAPGG